MDLRGRDKNSALQMAPQPHQASTLSRVNFSLKPAGIAAAAPEAKTPLAKTPLTKHPVDASTPALSLPVYDVRRLQPSLAQETKSVAPKTRIAQTNTQTNTQANAQANTQAFASEQIVPSNAEKPIKTSAYSTISEVAEALDLPQHVLRFWETRFSQIRPMKRAGGRRFYRPEDVALLYAIRHLLYDAGYTIKGVKRLLTEQGAKAVIALSAVNGHSFSAPLHPDSDEDNRAQDMMLDDDAGDDLNTPHAMQATSDCHEFPEPLDIANDPVQPAPSLGSFGKTFSVAYPAQGKLQVNLNANLNAYTKANLQTHLYAPTSSHKPLQQEPSITARQPNLEQNPTPNSPVSSLINRLQKAAPLSVAREIPVTITQGAVAEATPTVSRQLHQSPSQKSSLPPSKIVPDKTPVTDSHVRFFRSTAHHKIVPYDSVVMDEEEGFITLEPDLAVSNPPLQKAASPQTLEAFKREAVQKLQAALYELMECQALLERDFTP